MLETNLIYLGNQWKQYVYVLDDNFNSRRVFWIRLFLSDLQKFTSQLRHSVCCARAPVWLRARLHIKLVLRAREFYSSPEWVILKLFIKLRNRTLYSKTKLKNTFDTSLRPANHENPWNTTNIEKIDRFKLYSSFSQWESWDDIETHITF